MNGSHSKANQIIEHWRNRLAEKAKEIYLPEDFNGGRPRLNSTDPERAKGYERLMKYEERCQILKHPQRKPKAGKQREYLRVNSVRRLWSDKQRFEDVKPLDEDDLKRIISLQFGVKLVDMGNACYIDKQFSDVI